MTVADNVMAILEMRADLDEAARDEALERLLEELHVAHLRDHLGMSLSGGERRRVEIARALAANPAFILLDEPFAGVDPLSVLDIQRIARQLAERGIGVLITDHNVRETLGICGRAYIVNQGSILASGSAEEILANPEVRKVYLGQDFRL
jgi:lipopolysaccharide export system ATP-binding protein